MVIGDALNYAELYAALQDVEDRVRPQGKSDVSFDEGLVAKASDKGLIRQQSLNAHPKIFVFRFGTKFQP